MKRSISALRVPLGSFGLALLLATLAGPGAIQARRAPLAQTVVPCVCALKIQRIDASLSWTATLPNFVEVSQFDLDISSQTYAEKKKDAAPATLKVDASIDWLVKATLTCWPKGQPGNTVVTEVQQFVDVPVPPAGVHDLTCPGQTHSDSFFGQMDDLIASAEQALEREHGKGGLVCKAKVKSFHFSGSYRYRVDAVAKCGLATLKDSLKSRLVLFKGRHTEESGNTSDSAVPPPPKK